MTKKGRLKVVIKKGYADITEEDLMVWQPYALAYFAEVLNGKYDLLEAREDILSLLNDNQDGL